MHGRLSRTDANGAWLAYVYVYGDAGAQRTFGLFGLSGDEAAMVALAIADLPELLAGEPAPVQLPAAAPGPWTAEDAGGFFKVTAGSVRVALVHYADPRAGDLTQDEARRIAAGIAKLRVLAAGGGLCPTS